MELLHRSSLYHYHEVAGRLNEKGYNHESYNFMRLGNMHLRKIDISDEIFVINVDGYIGNSTKNEIEYTKKKGKTIRYYSDGEIPSQF